MVQVFRSFLVPGSVDAVEIPKSDSSSGLGSWNLEHDPKDPANDAVNQFLLLNGRDTNFFNEESNDIVLEMQISTHPGNTHPEENE